MREVGLEELQQRAHHSGGEASFPQRAWRDEVYAGLRRVMQGPGLAVLDWDNTCARGDIGEAIMRRVDTAGRFAERYEAWLAQGRVGAAYAECALLMAGLSPDQARGLAHEVLEQALSTGEIGFRPEVQDLVAALQAQDWEVWVVTASTPYAVQVAASHYGVSPSFVLGMDLVTLDGLLAPAIRGPVCFGPGKVQVIREQIGKVPDLALGDAPTDLDMLRFSGQALLVGEHPQMLRAAGQDWWMQPSF